MAFDPLGIVASPPDHSDLDESFQSFFKGMGDRIQERPDLRLSHNIEMKKTAKLDEEQALKEYNDSHALPVIMNAHARNEAHIHDINQQLDEFTKKLAVPHPIQDLAKPSMGTAIGAALVGAAGGNINTAAEQGIAGDQAKSDVDYRNKTNQWGATREDNQMIVQHLQRQLDEALTHGQKLEGYAFDEIGRASDQKHNDIEKAKSGFANAKSSGDVQFWADELEKLGIPVKPETLQQAKMEAGVKKQHEDFSEAEQLHRGVMQTLAMYGGAQTKEDLKALDDQITYINGHYGTNYPPVPGGPTEKARHDTAMDKEKDQARKDTNARFEKHEAGLKMRFDKSEKDKVANWAEERAIARANADSNHLRAVNSSAVSHHEEKVKSITAELHKVRMQLKSKTSSPTATGGPGGTKLTLSVIKGLRVRQAQLEDKLAGAQALLGDAKADQSKDEQDFPVTDEPSGGAGGVTGKVLYNKDGVTITKK